MKKLIALLLTIVMVMSLAACGSNAETPTDPPATEATSVASDAPATEPAVPLTNAERYPLESDATFRVIFTDEGLEEKGVVAMWEEATGIDTEVLSWTEEQMLTSLASGDYPDAIVQPYGLSRELVYEYGVAGKFINFKDYLHLMPNLQAMIEKYPQIMDVCTYPDGAMYSLPKINWTPTAQGNVLYINTNVMEELGWSEAPATTDEFLQFIKEAQAHYEGTDSEFVAFHCRDNSYMKWTGTNTVSAYFFPSFGELIETGLTLDSNGNVTLGAATEQYKHYLEFMHEVWESGAFETEIYTLDSAAGTATIQEYHTAVSAATHGGKGSAEHNNGIDDTTVLEPLTSEYYSEKHWMKTASVNYIGSVVSASCSDIETMVQWMDAFYSTEENPLNEEGTIWGISLWLGELGVDWEKDDETLVYRKLEGARSTYNNPIGIEVFSYFSEGGTTHVKALGTLLNCLPYGVEKSGIENLTLSEDDQDDYADIWTDMESYIAQMHAKFITGEEDIEAGWDAYLKNLEKMGLPEVLEMYQHTYDAK